MASSSTSRVAPRVRVATLADTEAWTDVMLSGYEVDLQFRWRYPNRKEYPELGRKATREVFEASLENKNCTCLVAELPSIEPGRHEEWVVVALAVWEWKNWEDVKSGVPLSSFEACGPDRLDMDQTRQTMFLDAIVNAERDYFGPEWGETRLDLADMVADPRYFRRGAGRALMDYGLEKATEANVPITLTASPLGRYLYLSLGFKDYGYFECSDEGSDEKVGTWAMAWTPPGWEKKAI